MTFFSVIIPTYNRAHILPETINTVLNQVYREFEIIIVDDGSTDDTGDIIKSRYGDNGLVRYFFKQNEERAAARNFGLEQARGDYAVFFDSDDLMNPGYLQILDKIITDQPGIFLLAAKYNYLHKGKYENHPVLSSLPEGWYDRNIFLKGNILACNFCLRIREKSYKIFPPERELASMEDWLFLLQNLEKKKIYIRDELGVTMRHHDDRTMMNNQKVIVARKKATQWVLDNLSLAEKEKETLRAWSHYFCGVHQYLDHKRSAAVKDAFTAIKKAGLQGRFLKLLIKSLIGRKIIASIR